MFIFATMKQRAQIAILWVAVVLAACHRPVETRHGTSLPPSVSPELQAVDSLMWQRPDSALVRLLPWFDTCCRDAARHVSTAKAYNDHYAHLLLAELLYKNDYAQTNREELRQAVAYFDSLVRQAPPLPPCKGGWGIKRGPGGLKHTLPNPNATLFFLAARAHYINGVGYYERDSVVPACAEYLKALETMDYHFAENELVGHRARFIALTYNHLGEMFSDLFMMDAAIYCYKNSCKISMTSLTSTNSVSSALYRIGNQFDIKNESDSANYYYMAAISNIPDTLNLLYRDIVSSQSLLYYQLTHQSEPVLRCLKQITAQTVFNAVGQLVETVHHTNQIVVSGWAKGVYVVKIMGNDGFVCTKRIAVVG